MSRRHMDVRPFGERVKARMEADARPQPERKVRPLQLQPDAAKIDRRAWALVLSVQCPAHEHGAPGASCYPGLTAACGARRLAVVGGAR